MSQRGIKYPFYEPKDIFKERDFGVLVNLCANLDSSDKLLILCRVRLGPGLSSALPLRLTKWLYNQMWCKQKAFNKRDNKINLNLIFRFFWCAETTNRKKYKNKTIILITEINKSLISMLLLSLKYKIFLLVIRLQLLKTPIAAQYWLRLTGIFKRKKIPPEQS